MSFCLLIFFAKIMVGFFLYFRQATCRAHPSPELYLERVEMKFSVMQAFPIYCHFVPLRPRYLPQNSVHKYSLCSFRNVTELSHTDIKQRRMFWVLQPSAAAITSCAPYACNGGYFVLMQ
jgi:hypothetical protein